MKETTLTWAIKFANYYKGYIFERYKDTSLKDLITTLTMLSWKMDWKYISSFGTVIFVFSPPEKTHIKYQIDFQPLNNFSMKVYESINFMEHKQVPETINIPQEKVFDVLLNLIIERD